MQTAMESCPAKTAISGVMGFGLGTWRKYGRNQVEVSAAANMKILFDQAACLDFSWAV